MPDPFVEPEVAVALLLRGRNQPLSSMLMTRSEAVDLSKQLMSRERGAGNIYMLKHNVGVSFIDLDEVDCLTVVSGSELRTDEFIDLVI
jgi:hypothetical protein